MATVIPHKDKNGKIVSYQIQVYRGRDSSGKKLKPYVKSWKVPETYKTEKAIEKALAKVVGEFETACKRGEVTTDKRTFSEYAKYYIELKQRDSKIKAIEFYNNLLPRIDEEIGFIKISALTAEHLNRFYLKLEKEEIRRDNKARGNETLITEKKKRNLTNDKICKMSGLSKNTVATALQCKNIAITSAEKISNAFDMKTNDLFEIISLGNGKGLSSKTIHHYHSFIHAILKQAKREKVVRENVAEDALPPSVRKKEAEFFEIDEILEIRRALEFEPMKYRVMICLLVDSGIRRGELFGIRWPSIDFKNGEIKIDNNVQWSSGIGIYNDTTKTDESRTVSISPEMISLLSEYRKEQRRIQIKTGGYTYNKDGYLFIQDNGNIMHPSSLNKWLTRFEKRYNLPHIYPHKFRHSQASILYACNVDIVTISNRLGHKQVSTTQDIYAHMMKESDRKASNAIIEALYKNA